MNRELKSCENKVILAPEGGRFGVRFAPNHGRGRRARPGRLPQTLANVETRHKLLKIGRLQVFQVGTKMPCFRQAANWPKWETVWVNGSTARARHEQAHGLAEEHLTK